MDYAKIEKKWQKIWEKEGVFKAVDFSDKPKFYGLIEFPYPSGVGLHIGHIKAFSSMEVISRMKRLQGYNVLFPIGWDAFGLPTENYAIKHNIAPRIATDTNIEHIKQQLEKVGFSFDWDITSGRNGFLANCTKKDLRINQKHMSIIAKVVTAFCQTKSRKAECAIGVERKLFREKKKYGF